MAFLGEGSYFIYAYIGTFGIIVTLYAQVLNSREFHLLKSFSKIIETTVKVVHNH